MLVLPFALLRRRGVTTLEFADFGLCDYLGPVYDPADLPLLLVDATLSKRIAAALPRHDVLALTKLAGEQTLLASLFPDMHRARMRISAYPAALAPDWPAWRAERLNPSVRRELDMKRRRLVRSGPTEFSTLRDAQAITAAFDALRRYRSARFKAIGAADCSTTRRSSGFTAEWRSRALRTPRRAPNASPLPESRSPCSSGWRSKASIRC
jgi:CelD/BcsL family acetyltransferase involved in cellulose biosynthesis